MRRLPRPALCDPALPSLLRAGGLAAALGLSAAAPADAQADSARVILPPIAVDVLRAGVPLVRLPVAATLLDSARTQRAGAGFSLEGPLRGVPGLQLDDRHNQALGERLSIRGFGARASFGVRGVHVRVDDVPATMADGQTTLNHVDPAAIAAAEVVRGPAAAFLGNAAGGALLLRTGAPEGSGIQALMGAYGQRSFAAARARAGAGGSYHVRASLQRSEGWRDHAESERWLLNGALRGVLGSAQASLAVHATHYDARNPGALSAEQLAVDPRQANPGNVTQRTGERGTHAQAGAGVRLPTRAGELEIRAYGGARSLDNPIPPRIIDLERTFGGAGVQLRRHVAAALLLGAGVEVAVQSDERRNWVNDEGAPGELVLDQRERVIASAARATATWLGPRGLELLAAARYDRHAFRVRDARVSATDPDDSGRRVLDAASGALGVGWAIAPALRLFASAGTAFETPTTTELANRADGAGGFNPQLEPERTRSIEAGARGRAARLAWELVVFDAGVRDKLLPFEVADAPGRQYFRNAGRTRHRGLEAGLQLDAPVGTVWATFTRLDARFQDYLVAGVSLEGRRVPGVAGHWLEAGALATPVRGWHARVQLRRTGRTPVDDANTAFAPAYTLVGARVDGVLAVAGIDVEPYLGVENFFDREYIAAVTVNAFGGRYYEPGSGRSLYAGLRLQLR
jgi:iron complex outermembrane receptor protein